MSFKSLIARLMQLARTQVFKLDKVAINEGIKFADKSVNQFETKISNKIGTPLPIDFSVEELFGNKLREVSGNFTDKLEARSNEKAKERAERREDREELERAREARHIEALEDINKRYQDKLGDINKRSFATVPETIIHFFPPPITRVIGGIETTIEQESYKKTFSGDVIPKLYPRHPQYREFDPRSITSQGANEKDLEIINNARKEPGEGGKMYISVNYSSMGVKEVGRERNKKLEAFSSYEVLLEPSKTTKGATPELSKGEADKLREEAKLQYQRELEEENLLWEEEKKQNRQTDRENRDLEKEAKEKAKEEEKEAKEKARRKRKYDRRGEKQEKEEQKEKEKEERKETKEEEEKRKKQEKEDQKRLRGEQKEQEKELRQTRKDAIDEVKQLRAAGDITREQERDLIKQIEEATKIEDVKEKKDRKFDTSFLRDPVFVSSIYQSTYQFLPQQTKDELGEAVREYLPVLENTVKFASILKSAIVATKGILTSLGKTGQTLNITGTAINVATNTITSLPIPTSVPPGVGLPLNLITQLSQNLDRLSDQSKKIEGAGELINETVPDINDKLDRINDTLIIILDVVTILLDIIIFIDYIAKSGQSSLNDLRDQVGNDINNALEESGNSSNEGENVDDQLDLLSRLNPNSTNPLFYKDFRLTLQYQSGEGELTQTRVLGVNSSNGVSLATDLSYTTSPEVLVQEIQFKIDNYDLIFINDPNIPVLDQIDNIDIDDVAVDVVIPEADLDLDIEIEGLPERLTKKEIRDRKRKDRRKDRKERREDLRAGEITRKDARQDRRNDRKERKQEAKERRKNRKRKREG